MKTVQRLVFNHGIPRLTLTVMPRPFVSVTENLRILVSVQLDKATGFVIRATYRLGERWSPDDNDVFSDRRWRAVSAQGRLAAVSH